MAGIVGMAGMAGWAWVGFLFAFFLLRRPPRILAFFKQLAAGRSEVTGRSDPTMS